MHFVDLRWCVVPLSRCRSIDPVGASWIVCSPSWQTSFSTSFPFCVQRLDILLDWLCSLVDLGLVLSEFIAFIVWGTTSLRLSFSCVQGTLCLGSLFMTYQCVGFLLSWLFQHSLWTLPRFFWALLGLVVCYCSLFWQLLLALISEDNDNKIVL